MKPGILKLPSRIALPTLSVGVLLLFADCSRVSAGGLLREVYTGIAGDTIGDLMGSPKFPDTPDATNIIQEFEAPTDAEDNYGQRVRGFIIPPTTGNYLFWIASDDNSVLSLSTSEDPNAKQEIAGVPGWTSSREWDKYAEQQSASVSLQAGRAYYVEALMKEGTGGDNLAVRWQLPDGTIEEPIPEPRLLVYGVAFTPPVITAQPTNLTVIEGEPATFAVHVSNPDPVRYQWQRTRTNILDATAARYTLPAAAIRDDGILFRCRLSNSLGTVFTDEARLTVLPDRAPPTLSGAQNFGQRVLTVLFSEPVELASATNVLNYAIDPGIQINTVTLNSDLRMVTLDTSPLTYGAEYTLTVNHIRDRAATPNAILPDSQLRFLAVEYAPQGIGNPVPPGSSTPVPGGVDLVGTGLGLEPKSDQFLFSHQRRTGDFDVRVRLETLELSDVWASAGLMARATLDTNSPYAAVLATPSISGISYWSRVSTNTPTTSGSCPVNYPWTWLRLQRAGNLFTGYASFDGMNWLFLGSSTNALPGTLHFGMAASSHVAGQTARAQFRDLANVVDAVVVPELPYNVEPIGPSSRRTGLAISEIMYHPADRPDGRDLEFVELFNSQPTAEDLSGYRLSGSIEFTFPANTTLPAGSFLVVARVPADVAAVYGIASVIGGYPNDLPNGGSTLRLRDNLGAVLLEVTYGDEAPWPVAADGSGHSLVLARPSYGEGSPVAWAASQFKGGSPGRGDAIRPDPLEAVRINEFLAHTDPPAYDYVELYNASNQTVDLSGAVLTDDPILEVFVIPDGTTLAPRGFVVFTENALGFALNSSGETLYLLSRDRSRVVDVARFGPQANGVASGRHPDGAGGFEPLQALTPGSANASPRIPDVVINEIMYHPISEDPEDEYIELHNRSGLDVDVSHWRFMDGIDYAFPTNTVIAAGGYLVVARNAARVRTNYAQLNPLNTVGDFQGQLSDQGERVALTRPSDLALPHQDLVIVDEVTYGDGGRWGRWSDGGGSSLELTDARSDNRLAANWADSAETAKAPWATVEATGVLDLGMDPYGIDHLEVMLMGPGEALIDDVEVIGPNGANLVANSTFEQDQRSWTVDGTHIRSSWEPLEGYASQHSLHLRASARGSTDSNKARTELLLNLAPGSYATLRAKIRWLCGTPEILLRLRGNYLEAAGTMSLPRNLGTPGARNSRAAVNAGPAITDVRHRPVLPALGQPAYVMARASDPDGIASLTLKYRVDPQIETITVDMLDDGTGGDALAGDGIYTAAIPGQPTTNLVAFHIQALDDASSHRSRSFPADAPTRECLVRWGEVLPAGNLGSYRLWCTQAIIDEWANRAPSSNDPLDGTFAYGNFRAVYGMSTLYSGSPYHWTGYDSPLGNNCTYILLFPPDDLFLGATDFVLNLPSNMGSDRTAQREQIFYWMAKQLGRPYTYRRFHWFTLNGHNRGFIFEDAQQPNRDFVEEWSADDPEGELFKIEDWFEFDNNAMGFANMDATLDNFIGADGTKKQPRYRWNFRKRAVRDSAHEYTRLFALADALNLSEPLEYTAQAEALVDVEQWMRAFALRHVVGDWDAFGYRRGKNMYAYKPTHGKWQLYDWDVAFAFGLGDGPTHNLFDAAHFDGTIDTVSERMYNHPPFRRAYLRALSEAINGPMLSTNVNPVIDAKYAALKANAVNVSRPDSVKSWIANRRSFIAKYLATNTAAFAITSNDGQSFVVSSGRNLIELSGTAPIEARTLRANGIAYPVTWTSITNWTMRVPLRSGPNSLGLRGHDAYGNALPTVGAGIQVTLTGADARPEDHLVITEIMYHPYLENTGFVEIHNTSATYTFDLTGYRLRGLDFDFAEGTLIEPGAYLVVVSDRAAFIAAYGTGVPIAGEFPGRLRNDGELLSLVRSGPVPQQELVVDQVTYGDQAPWPAGADGLGSSLQLVDPTLDNRRIANWTAVAADPGGGSGWRFASITGTARSSTLYFYLTSSGDVYLDDVALVAGSVPEGGTNCVKDPGFEGNLANHWVISQSDPETRTTTAVRRSGNASLHVVSTEGGNSFLPSISQTTFATQQGLTYTLSFWYLPSPSGGGLTAGLSGSELQGSVSLVPGTVAPTPATPGSANSVQATLAPFPSLWINEVQPDNSTGPADRMGDRDPWIELYNPGPSAVSLADCYLTDHPTNLSRWQLPPASSVPARGYLLVWTDGEPAESTPSEPHADFRLAPTAGVVVLAQSVSSQVRVLDYVAYDGVRVNRSFGSYPDADPYARQVFQVPTPAAPNSIAVIPVTIFINEWQASNRGTRPDPADNDFDDWFELFNPNDFEVDLSGYTLTDILTSPTMWTIPDGTVIPAHGFLLCWADEETGQNDLQLGLHTNFRLERDGDTLGLFAPDGRLVDSVTFGPQEPDISEGRYPDGSTPPFRAQTTPTPGDPNWVYVPEIKATSVFAAPDGLTITWSVVPGLAYQVEYLSDLGGAQWLPLGGPLTAIETTLSITDPSLLADLQRFYRLTQLP